MKQRNPLLTGEKPIEFAPPITLRNGEQCIPQHYLVFAHTRASVEEIIVDIEFDNNYLIFVCEDNSGIYIQIGIVGFDNYVAIEDQKEKKVVYGRKWRVEHQLPTSEIIQTVFLAIKTAREHEIRELLQLDKNGRVTTPFNNHHDLPLMAQNSELVSGTTNAIERELSDVEFQRHLDTITYDSSTFECLSLKNLDKENWLVEIELIKGKRSQLPETKSKTLFLVLSKISLNEFNFQLMDVLIRESNRYIEEHFTYLGFARFSHTNSIDSISDLSSVLRQQEMSSAKNVFSKILEKTNYQTDKTRVPALSNGPQSNKIRNQLNHLGELEGILPAD